MELFRQDEIDRQCFPAMAYLSMTRPGISRGPHEHREQTDIIIFVGFSRFKLKMWDNRPQSPTYGRHSIIEAEEERCMAIIIPPGIVHAYKNIGAKDGLVLNAPNRLYAGNGKSRPVDEIRYEDLKDSKFKLDF